MPKRRSAFQEAKDVLKQFRFIFMVAFLVIFAGSLFYHFVEDWRWLDAIYFSIISLATVGYGDLTPQTDAGKIFTIFYLVFGIGIFAALVNNLLKSGFAQRSLRLHELEETKKKN